MNQCPQCDRPGTLAVAPVMVAKPPASAALPGAQLKLLAEQKWTLTCTACGFHLVGRLDNAVIDPHTGSFTGGHFVAERRQAV